MLREKRELEKRITGSLIGLAVGDVLGCPLEGMHPDAIASQFGRVTGLVSPLETAETNLFYWRMPGAHSDDTQQALTLADVLVDFGRLDTAAVMDRWKDMSAARIEIRGDDGEPIEPQGLFGCHRGTSGSFRRRVKKPQNPREPNWGDGAAMRVAPIGLFYRDATEERIEAAVQSALLTHGHPHAVASAVAVAAAVACLCGDPAVGANDLIQSVTRETQTGEKLLKAKYAERVNQTMKGAIGEFSATLSKLSDWLASPLESALASIAANGRTLLPLPREVPVFAAKSASILAVVTALLLATRNLDSFYDGMVETLNLGGDADTIGAMVGAILGARLGSGAIPAEWKDHVLVRQQVEVRGQRMAGTAQKVEFVEQVIFETEISRLEERAKWELRKKLRC